MDEQQNNGQNEQPSAIEQVGKQAVDMGKQVVKDQTKKLAKEALKQAILAIGHVIMSFLSIAWPYLLAAAIIALLVAGGEWVVDNYIVDNVSEQADLMIETYCTVDETGIHFDKEQMLEAIEKELEEGGISKADLGLGADNVKASKYLYSYMEASMATQLPYIPTSDPEAQGNVYFYRDLNEDEVADEQLQYMGYESFKQILESGSREEKDNLKQYFSLDELWNLCITKTHREVVNDEEKVYQISEVKIPYKTMISQYGMPFEFLITLLRVSQNPEYVQAVADLENKNSRINLTIFDDIERVTTIVKEEYDYYYNKQKQYTGGGSTSVVYNTVSEHKLITTKTMIETYTIKANVTSAKTWIINQETPYDMETSPEGSQEPATTGPTGYGVDKTGDQEEAWWVRNKYVTTEVIKETKEWNKVAGTTTNLTPSQFLGLWKNDTGTYVEGAEYNVDGKIVNYKEAWYTTQTANIPVVSRFASYEAGFYQLLENHIETQQHSELMRYLIGLYKSKKTVDEYRWEEVQTSIYEPDEFVEGTYSYTGGFDVHDESLFITDIETLKKAFLEGYSGNEKLLENAQAFLDMQDKYKVNAIFAAAVSVAETSAGRTGNATNGKNNWFNIRLTSTEWRRYGSPEEAISGERGFGWQIAEGSYFYKENRYTVYDIGHRYCPNSSSYPTQADDWIATVTAQMKRFYKAAGLEELFIQGEGTTAEGFGYDIAGAALSNDKFSAMLAEAEKYLGYPYVYGGSSPSTSFDCSGYVSWVINQSGVGNVGRATANSLRNYCAYVPKDQAQPGDLIFFQGTYNTTGASHVGIYIGNGQMIHCGDPISKTSINTNYWQKHFLDFGRIQ